MADLKDIIAYLLLDYPDPDALANARVTKMVYLADWKSALDHGRQMSSIAWFFDNFGPYVTDVRRCADQNPELFQVKSKRTSLGGEKNVFILIDRDYQPNLSTQEKEILDHVRKQTEDLSFDKFVKLVYSTYPVVVSDRFDDLNLVEMAKVKQSGNQSAGRLT